jgi:Flp pilus assembly pilin Flp
LCVRGGGPAAGGPPRPSTGRYRQMTLHHLDNFILRPEDGQTMTEYSVVLGLIVIITMVAYQSLGDSIEHALNAAKGLLP